MYRDFSVNAFDVLKEKNIPALLFITNNFVNSKYESFLSWEDIRYLVESNLITIGAHSLNHIYLRSLLVPDQKREIIDSKNDLESKLGVQIVFFSYPGGGFGQDTLAIVKDNYLAAFADRAIVSKKINKYTIPRISIDKNCVNMESFINLVNSNFIKL